MNDNDMSEMIKKAQYMIQNNQIPDDIKNLINNFQSSNNFNSSNINSKSYNNSNNTYNNSKNNSNYNNYYNQNQSYKNYSKNNSSNSNNNDTNSSQNSSHNSSSSSASDIDMETLMKIQNIMSKIKSSDNDDMSRLLLSLKPYLRDGRKDKIDEYIKLIKMGKMTQFMNSFGGDKK